MKQWISPDIKELDFLCTNFAGRHHGGGHHGHSGKPPWHNGPRPPIPHCPTDPPRLS